MMKSLCDACLLPFEDGDEVKEVGNNTLTMVRGKKSGQMVAIPLNDPALSVLVHRHCTVAYENPRSNEEFMAAVEEMKRHEWESQWREEHLDSIRQEAYDLAHDDLKTICGACKEEIEYMGSEEEPRQSQPAPMPWGFNS